MAAPMACASPETFISRNWRLTTRIEPVAVMPNTIGNVAQP